MSFQQSHKMDLKNIPHLPIFVRQLWHEACLHALLAQELIRWHAVLYSMSRHAFAGLFAYVFLAACKMRGTSMF